MRILFDLGLQHHRVGRLAEAEAIYRQVLAVAPQHVEAMHMLGVISLQCGRDEAAVEMIQEAIALAPTLAAAHSNLGEGYRKLGRRDKAIAAYRRAIELRPCYPEALSNLGNVLVEEGYLDDAVAACRRALEFSPDFAEAHNNLGNALSEQGHLEQAVASYRHALKSWPDYVEAHNNLGNALSEQGKLDEALSAYQQALSLQPDMAETHYNMGNAWKDRGEVELAVAAYRHALALQPTFAVAHSNLLHTLHYRAGDDAAAAYREHLRWNEVHAGPLAKLANAHDNDRNPGRRLRIGYVSPDFREHPVAFFVENLFAHHDGRQFELFCYSNAPVADRFTERFRQLAGRWHNIRALTDEQAAALIREDRIDILIDLAGHTADHRLLLFARKPAPVQGTYLGYCDTTGMSAMDFRLTDEHADPVGLTEHLHSERLVRLPGSAWCFRSPEDAPEVAPAPVLRAGHVTFGCFNALPKTSPATLALWAEILRASPKSRLLLKAATLRDASAQRCLRAAMTEAGIGPDRVDFLGPTLTNPAHLADYARVDIALDTFPYHGTTTTCDALHMGVPVVTLAGKTHAARVGVSLLMNLGLQELIAGGAEDYVAIALALAADVPRLLALRTTLRARMAASPLQDAPGFARNIETAYRQIWRGWCAQAEVRLAGLTHQNNSTEVAQPLAPSGPNNNSRG